MIGQEAMTTPAAQDLLLDDIRREIDAIDDQILDLVARLGKGARP